MKNKGLQPRLLYPVRLTIKTEGKINIFSDKTRLKEYISTKPALQDILEGLLQEEKGKEWEREEQYVQRGEMNKYL